MSQRFNWVSDWRLLPSLFYVSIFVFLAGCMGSPQNHQKVQASAPITFAGSIPEGENGQVPKGYVYVIANGISVDIVPISQTDPFTDSVGKKWYSWSTNKTIPYSNWSQVPGQNELTVQVQAYFGSSPLATFDWIPPSNPQCEEAMKSQDTMAILNYCRDYVSPAGYPAPSPECNEAKTTQDLTKIISACKSGESPFVTLTSNCGGYKEACCQNSTPCGGAYECAEILYDTNNPPSGEYNDVIGSDYNPNTHAPSGQGKATLCLARMPDNTLR